MKSPDPAVWRELGAAYSSGQTIEVTVIRANPGGLVVDVGARGFLPIALIEAASEEIEQLDRYVGRQMR